MAVTFALAQSNDEGEIRRMLRENPLGGSWRISPEREPDGLGGPHVAGERRVFVLARDSGSGEVVAICERLVRPAFVDGEQRLLPYLGALRIAESHRHRIAILKGGFATLRNHAERPDERRFALTSITTDNMAARRVLTAGFRGLPRYRPVGRFATLMMRAKSLHVPLSVSEASCEDLAEIAQFLRQRFVLRQFAPAWNVEALAAQKGLSFLLLREGRTIAGTIGVWDQRASRQVVLRGLPPGIGWLRRPANMLAPLFGMPTIPASGQRIEQAYLAALAVRDEDPELAASLVESGLALAARKGLQVATLGVPVNHPWRAAILRRFRAIEYLTELFLVHWPEADGLVTALKAGDAFPDVALL